MDQHRIHLRRAYEAPQPDDGLRVLVDRLWPRGLGKSKARIDLWSRDIAPSDELRRWFAHEPERWQAFRTRYRDELATRPEALSALLGHCRGGTVTLLYSARDSEHNNAVVLREVLLEELAEEARANEPASPVCYQDLSDELKGR
ncbi:MAG: DUF488 domain-containing protein [Thioalkalivibrio sp.]